MVAEPALDVEPAPRPLATVAFPAVLLDHTMARLNGGEWRVLCYLVRRSLCMGLARATLSLDQIAGGCPPHDAGTGMARKTVLEALTGLREKGLIVMAVSPGGDAGNQPSTFLVCLGEVARGH